MKLALIGLAIAALSAPPIFADGASLGPKSVDLTLTKEHPPAPVLIRAHDGRVFELSLKPGGSPGFFDLNLLRPGHRASARNLLEPKGNWHGLEPFEISARPASDPSSDMAAYGARRDIPVRNYPLVLHVEVRKVETEPGKDAGGDDDIWFKTLILAAELRPAK